MPYRTSAQPPGSSFASRPIPTPRHRKATQALNLLVLASPAVPFFFTALAIVYRAHEHAPISSLALPALCAFGALWIAVVAVWAVRRASAIRRGLHALSESETLLRPGHYEAALVACERVLLRYRGHGNIELAALNNLSIAVFHLGDPVHALAILDVGEGSGCCPPGSVVLRQLWLNRALYHGILGNVRDCERAAARARSAMSANRASTALVLYDVVLAARTGRFDDVVASTGTTAAMALLQNRLLRVLRAWALVATAPEATREDVRVLLDGARPMPPGALRFASEHWPELRTFLVEHGLTEAL